MRRRNPLDFGLLALSALGGAFATAIYNNLNPGVIAPLPPQTLQLASGGTYAVTATANGGVLTVVAPSGATLQSVSIVEADGQTPLPYTANPASPVNQAAQQTQGFNQNTAGASSSQSWTFATTAQTATATVTWSGANSFNTGNTVNTGGRGNNQNNQGGQQSATITLTLQ